MAIKFLNTVQVDTDVLYVDAANDRVGIGTASPDYLLDLYKSTDTGSSNDGTTLQRLWNYVGTDIQQQKTFIDFVFQDDNDNEYPQVRIGAEVGQNGNAGTQILEGSGAFVVYTNNATGDGPGAPTGLAERFRVDYRGNVGIGTTSPSEKLEVDGRVKIQTTAGSLIIQESGAGSVKLTSSATLSIEALSNFRVRTGPLLDENFTVLSTGNVGIGTTSPISLLEISQQLSAASTIDYPYTISSRDDANSINQAGGEGVGIKFRIAGNAATTPGDSLVGASIAAIRESASDTDSSTGLGFFVTQNDETLDEAMRITNAGGISFGSTGTAYGFAGQVLTSAGNASPTWITPSSGTVTGTGSATQVAFWTGASSLSGNSDLWWDNTNGHLGIGDTTPNSKLKVGSGTSETSIYTVDINHVRNDANVATQAMRINVDLSGADTTTADRTNYGLFVDLDSSANGDATHEQRLKGIGSDVRFTGFTDLANSGYFLAESNYRLGKTSQLVGVYGSAVHDTASTDGGVSNMYGVYGTSSIQDLGDVDNAFGGYFSVSISTNRGNANVGVTKGVEGHIDIDKADTITYGEMMAVSGIIDNNEGTVPTFGNQYLFKGDYQGTKGGNAYGIYTEGDKHYFDGNIGIRTSNPTSKLTVGDNGITTKIATATIADTTAGGSLTLRGGSPTIYFDKTGTGIPKILMDGGGLEFKTGTLDAEGDIDVVITAAGTFGIGVDDPSSKLQVDGGIQMADDTDTASASKVGTMRYRTGTEYVEVTGTELITNGDFATDTDWTKGTGWTISGGTANAATATSDFTQTVSFTLGQTYRLTYTISNYSAGAMRTSLGAYVANTPISANGNYTDIFTPTNVSSNSLLYFEGQSGFTGSIDNASMVEVTSEDASYADMCMQTGASTYEWVNIVRNTY